MIRRGPAGPEDRGQQDGDREHRLAALRIRLQAAAEDVRTAADWVRRLQTAAQLPAETWANVLLISSSRPDATLVKGYEAWRAAGRHVNRNEKGIEIFSGPRQQNGNRRHPEDGEHGHSWRDADHVTYVWDLSQTSGQPLPARAAIGSSAGAVPPGLWEALCWLARRAGYTVEREPGVGDADDRKPQRPGRLVRQGAAVGEVPVVAGMVAVSVDDLADGGAGGGFVDEVLGGSEGGDQGLQGEVVDGASRLVQAADVIAFLYRRVFTVHETDERSRKAKIAMWSRLVPRIHHELCWFPAGTGGQQALWGGMSGSCTKGPH